MQLSGAGRAAPADPGRTLSPFTRTLLALAVITVPALGGVLPEDRFDALWHYYNGGDITVAGPEVLVRKKVSDNLSLSAGYYEDMISSASIDVKLSASPYHETRKQENAGFDYLHGKTTYSAGYIHSREPDYIADTTYYSVSQDMFGDLTTLTLGYRRGWDQVFRDIKDPDGVIVNDPTFHQRADHRGYSLSLSQILTRNAILNFNYELLSDQGYLANPYRKIRYLSPGGLGFTLADQVYPNTRTSNAASLQWKYYLPWRAALTAQYRFFRDTWGIIAHTGELDYTLPVYKRWVFDGSLRYYQQTHADFYSDLFPRANYQNFMARDRELAAFHSYTIGAGASYLFPMPWFPSLSKNTLNVRADHLLIKYSDFRDALLAGEFGAGNEPLYTLNANIFQVYLSIWY
ncbi:MAG TPA: DUF3570 domain-containing protein [Steroidobacteraceae bacterium]|jgi:hypothetical protein|nr:DUF3570 domain-containing protein [Steroidobacteraceae bacterium]